MGPVLVTFDPPLIEVPGFAFSLDVHTQTDAGEPLSDLIRLMRAGETYINVHTENYPPGETRGQIRGS